MLEEVKKFSNEYAPEHHTLLYVCRNMHIRFGKQFRTQLSGLDGCAMAPSAQKY